MDGAACTPSKPNASLAALRTSGAWSLMRSVNAGSADAAYAPKRPKAAAEAFRTPVSVSLRQRVRACTAVDACAAVPSFAAIWPRDVADALITDVLVSLSACFKAFTAGAALSAGAPATIPPNAAAAEARTSSFSSWRQVMSSGTARKAPLPSCFRDVAAATRTLALSSSKHSVSAAADGVATGVPSWPSEVAAAARTKHASSLRHSVSASAADEPYCAPGFQVVQRRPSATAAACRTPDRESFNMAVRIGGESAALPIPHLPEFQACLLPALGRLHQDPANKSEELGRRTQRMCRISAAPQHLPVARPRWCRKGSQQGPAPMSSPPPDRHCRHFRPLLA
mmetsp:Transcript_12692/g.21849  ORF Transcript_12692/g.21849 Transcript_12692/m.21849 type:complete len:340 (+) Transcript_12692:428-1447(+)